MSNITTFLQNGMLTLQNAWFYTVMVVRLKNVVLMEVNGAFLATKVVRGSFFKEGTRVKTDNAT